MGFKQAIRKLEGREVEVKPMKISLGFDVDDLSINFEELERLIESARVNDYGSSEARNSLNLAFTWFNTPQGHQHWADLFYHVRRFTQDDIDFLHALFNER